MWDGFKKVFSAIGNNFKANTEGSLLGEALKKAKGARTPDFLPHAAASELGSNAVAGEAVQHALADPGQAPLGKMEGVIGSGQPGRMPLVAPPSILTPATEAVPMRMPEAPAPQDARAPLYDDIRREARFRAESGVSRSYDDPVKEQRIQGVFGDAVSGAPESRMEAYNKITRPSAGDRFKGALKPMMAGFVQGQLATGDWRGGVAGAGTGFAAASVDPVGGRDYYERTMKEPRRLQDEQRTLQRRRIDNEEQDRSEARLYRQKQMDNMDADNRRADAALKMTGEQHDWQRKEHEADLENRNFIRVGDNVVDRRTGKVVYAAPRQRRLMNIGGTAIDQDTLEEVYRAPAPAGEMDAAGEREVNANWDEQGYRDKFMNDQRAGLYQRLYITPETQERARAGDDRAVAQIQKAEEQLQSMADNAAKIERRRFTGRAASGYRRPGIGAPRPRANTSTAPRSPRDLMHLLQ